MKLHNCWKILLFPSKNLELLPINLLPTNHWLMNWLSPIPSSIDPSPPLESEVNKMVGPMQSLIDPTLPLESEVDTTQVFLVTSYSSRQGEISPISMEPLPNTEVISFYCNIQTEPHLHFQIIVQVCDNIMVHRTKVLLLSIYPQLFGKLWVLLGLCW
jgi:hypothetical protein